MSQQTMGAPPPEQAGRSTGRPPTGRGYGKPIPQSRILALAVLEAAGPDGLPTDDLVAALVGIGLTDNSARSRLTRDRIAGLVFGRGAYLVGRGICYRYFLTAEWCAGYVFDTAGAAVTRDDLRRAREREREARRWAAKTATETPEQRLARLDRDRTLRYAKLGYTEPPPRKTGPLVLTAEQIAERAEQERLRGRAKYQQAREVRNAERLAAGLPPIRPMVRRAVVVERPPARPGSELVARLVEVEAPVRVPKRPVLVGEPVITSATRVTIAAIGRDYRYWVDPAAVRPVFGVMAPGQYLEELTAE